MAMTPQEVAAKWAQRLSGSTTEIQNGINRVTEAPGVKAAAKQAKMKANLVKSIDDGTWARRVSSVTLDQWKRAFLEKGVSRIGQGAQAAQPKMAEFMAQLLPAQEAARQKISTMADLTLDDNLNRMTAYIREMAKFRKS